MRLKSLTLKEIAKIGLFLDDPFGDGGRLEKVRKPSLGRLAAIAELRGEPLLGGEELIRTEYETKVFDPKNWTKAGKLVASISRNIC